MAIKHIWLDFSETIAHINVTEHDKVKYETYASVVGKPVDEQLKKEFEKQYEQHHHSISDIFHSQGKPPGWWSSQLSAIEPSKLFMLADKDIPEILQKIKAHVPVSIFSNINLDTVLPAVGIDVEIFSHILSSGMVSRPKPALDGFYKIIELSGLKPEEILYVGDHVTKDIVPAKKVGLKAGIIWNSAEEADYSFSSFQDILDFVEN